VPQILDYLPKYNRKPAEIFLWNIVCVWGWGQYCIQ